MSLGASFKLLSLAVVLGITAGCAPQDLGSRAGATATPSTGKARFSEYPQPLFDAFRASCVGPARAFLTPARRTAECRELMPPEITAAFILRYDGTPEDLPRLVIRFRAEDQGASYLVTNDIFVNIPQKTGAPRQVPFDDKRLRQELDSLYLSAGGTPEA